MAIQFSETTNNTGLVQQARSMARVDANQWPTYKIANSANNWTDFVTAYAIGVDKKTQFDNTNHTKLPEGLDTLTVNVSDYAYTQDQQGNYVVTLLGVSILKDGKYVPLDEVDRNDPDYDISTFGTTSGTPTKYDKIADNIIRLDYRPTATVASGIKFYFQRTSPYFTAASTTATTGFSPLLDRGWVVACAYDIALTLGLANINALAGEREKEEQKVIQYFADRNQDTKRRMSAGNHSTR